MGVQERRCTDLLGGRFGRIRLGIRVGHERRTAAQRVGPAAAVRLRARHAGARRGGASQSRTLPQTRKGRAHHNQRSARQEASLGVHGHRGHKPSLLPRARASTPPHGQMPPPKHRRVGWRTPALLQAHRPERPSRAAARQSSSSSRRAAAARSATACPRIRPRRARPG